VTRSIPSEFQRRAEALRFSLLSRFILFSTPALLAGLWAVGEHLPDAGQSWSQAVAQALVLLLPRLAVAALVSFGWALAFARARGRDLDAGWLFAAWFYTLLLPAATPLPLVVIGLSFGLVFGCHVFGGTGRYIVSPALLGAVFLNVAYPAVMGSHWLPGGGPSTWSLAAGGEDALAAAGVAWLDAALGREVAAFGVPSAVLCLAGALILVLQGLASPRVIGGGLLGLLLVAVPFEVPGWHWQPVLGSFAFVLAFVATDPSTLPESHAGRWSLGLVYGALTVALRMLNPEHPEGSLFALLLASLITPLVDYWAAARRTAAGKA